MYIDQAQYDMAIQSFISWFANPIGLLIIGILIALIVFLSVVMIING